jgi:hypothetical protein
MRALPTKSSPSQDGLLPKLIDLEKVALGKWLPLPKRLYQVVVVKGKALPFSIIYLPSCVESRGANTKRISVGRTSVLVGVLLVSGMDSGSSEATLMLTMSALESKTGRETNKTDWESQT